MLGTETALALYYVGFGFVIFLGWAAIADELNRTVEPVRRNKLYRLAVGLALAGVLHPGFALAGRDIAVQLGRVDGPPDPGGDRTIRVANWGVVVALSLVALVLASHLGRFEDVPVFRQIRAGLPFA